MSASNFAQLKALHETEVSKLQLQLALDSLKMYEKLPNDPVFARHRKMIVSQTISAIRQANAWFFDLVDKEPCLFTEAMYTKFQEGNQNRVDYLRFLTEELMKGKRASIASE